ncbi:mucin-2-like [Penaeus chinensis]|uniref:mucin-2-like n=1 Tax=Penaeus chinensis TaxID=139456 RepID=UPI001FB7F4E9|nr:mucin-2-like [Penaeus chinensis]
MTTASVLPATSTSTSHHIICYDVHHTVPFMATLYASVLPTRKPLICSPIITLSSANNVPSTCHPRPPFHCTSIYEQLIRTCHSAYLLYPPPQRHRPLPGPLDLNISTGRTIAREHFIASSHRSTLCHTTSPPPCNLSHSRPPCQSRDVTPYCASTSPSSPWRKNPTTSHITTPFSPAPQSSSSRCCRFLRHLTLGHSEYKQETSSSSSSKTTQTPQDSLTRRCIRAVLARRPATLPSCRPTRLPSCRPTRLPSCRPTRLPSYPPAVLPACRPTRLPSCRPIRLPSTRLPSYPPAVLSS